MCGASFARDDAAVAHRYIPAIPECWSSFTSVLAREYEDPALFGAVHRLTVDTYAAQHPTGHPAKSLTAHLVSLYGALERGDADRKTITAYVESRRTFPELPIPDTFGTLTVCDLAAASSPTEHVETVRRWAAEVWQAWGPAHSRIAELYASIVRADR